MVSEAFLVNHLAAMEKRLGVKMGLTDTKVDKKTDELRDLRMRMDKNDSELDDRITRVVCDLAGQGAPVGGSGLPAPPNLAPRH